MKRGLAISGLEEKERRKEGWFPKGKGQREREKLRKKKAVSVFFFLLYLEHRKVLWEGVSCFSSATGG